MKQGQAIKAIDIMVARSVLQNREMPGFDLEPRGGEFARSGQPPVLLKAERAGFLNQEVV